MCIIVFNYAFHFYKCFPWPTACCNTKHLQSQVKASTASVSRKKNLVSYLPYFLTFLMWITLNRKNLYQEQGPQRKKSISSPPENWSPDTGMNGSALTRALNTPPQPLFVSDAGSKRFNAFQHLLTVNFLPFCFCNCIFFCIPNSLFWVDFMSVLFLNLIPWKFQLFYYLQAYIFLEQGSCWVLWCWWRRDGRSYAKSCRKVYYIFLNVLALDANTCFLSTETW